jgi:hypothetical protein
MSKDGSGVVQRYPLPNGSVTFLVASGSSWLQELCLMVMLMDRVSHARYSARPAIQFHFRNPSEALPVNR